MWKEGEELPSEETPYLTELVGSDLTNGKYILLDTEDTYAEGVHTLHEAAVSDVDSLQPLTPSGVIRPLTFRDRKRTKKRA